jgi:hypothetical protein
VTLSFCLEIEMLINARTAFADRVVDNSAPETADLDSYQTPIELTRALIHIEGDRIPQVCWEYGAGVGNIVTALRESGRTCYASDIWAGYGFPGTKIEDYRDAVPEWDVEGIVTNPPFTLALEFLKKSISEVPYVAYLLRTNFLESTRRLPFFRDHPPSRVWISSRRFNMHRHGWVGKRVSSNQCFAWFVFQANSTDKCRLGWFDYKTLETA